VLTKSSAGCPPVSWNTAFAVLVVAILTLNR
jgi:hypothetical protein